MDYKIQLNDSSYIDRINAETFADIAMEVFRLQYHNNVIYRQFADITGRAPASVNSIEEIPFLPVSFFKTHKVITGNIPEPGLVFASSGTTADTPAQHYVHDAGLYERSLLKGFEETYGSPKDYAILALLPSYLERRNASLVYMARVLMEKSGHPSCGFYLNEWDKLQATLQQLQTQKQPVLLLGVTFALLDFAAACPMELTNTIVMETGGMKGRREEWTREQVHTYLRQQWHLNAVHSEYGMTELLSQAYAKKDGIFSASTTMQVFARDMNDPFDVQRQGAGCLNIIDLANIHSCSFIATDDIGRIAPDGSFEVLGRVDHSALRGCNLMVL